MNQLMDKKEFWNTAVSLKIKSGIKNAAGAAYLSAAITFVFAFFISRYMIVDAVLALSLGLGIQFKKSRVCACVLIVYYVISRISLLGSGFSATNLIMTFAFFLFYMNGIKATFQYQKLWKLYIKGEYIPEEKVDLDMGKIHDFLNEKKQYLGTDGYYKADSTEE
jgi:hypothetical protein